MVSSISTNVSSLSSLYLKKSLTHTDNAGLYHNHQKQIDSTNAKSGARYDLSKEVSAANAKLVADLYA